MASPFAVTAAANSVRLDDNQAAVTTFTVSNVSGRTLTGRAQLRTDQPAALPWLSLAGESEQVFAPNQAVQYSVNIAVPPGSPEGAYTFSIDMIGVEDPDEMFSMGPPVSIEVKQVEVVKNGLPSWWWIPVLAGVVLLVGGALAFIVLRPGGGPGEAVRATITLTTSSVIDLDSSNAISEPSDRDDLEYLEAGTTHIFVAPNRARIVASSSGLTLEQCQAAARDSNVDLAIVSLGQAAASASICVETGEGGISLIQASLVGQGDGGGPATSNLSNDGVRDLAAELAELAIDPSRPATFNLGNDGVRELAELAELAIDPSRPAPPTNSDVRLTFETQPK